MSITKDLVLLHNGTITVSSEGKNKGSVFSVVLPTIPAPIKRTKQNEEDLMETETESIPTTILLVEDNKSTLLVMNRMLKRLGHNVITAMSIKEGILNQFFIKIKKKQRKILKKPKILKFRIIY